MNRFRSQFRKIWVEIRWAVIGGLWLLGLILGFIGFTLYGRENGIDFTVTERIYRSLQLISMNSGAVDGVNNWILDLSRFLMPVLTAYTALQAIFHLFREQTQWLYLWRMRDHIILCGLGRKGSYLIDGLLSKGMRVVAIEKNIDSLAAMDYRRRGAIILEGDATDPDTLESARLTRASYIICALRADHHNLTVAHQAFRHSKNQRHQVLTCIVHLESQDLLNLVKQSELNTIETDLFVLEIFNTYQRAASRLIHDDPGWGEASEQHPGHLLVIGLGRLGQNLIHQTAYAWHVLKQPEPLSITVVDLDAERKVAQLLENYPHLDGVTQIKPVQVDLRFTKMLIKTLTQNNDLQGVDRVYSCISDPILGIQTYLALRQLSEIAEVPFRIRLGKETGLAGFLDNPLTGQIEQKNLILFDMFAETCSAALVLGGVHEELSNNLRKNYLKNLNTPEAKASLKIPWEAVPEEEKEANRQQVQRIYRLLDACGYRINPLQNWDAGEYVFPKDEVLKMAQMEHELWCQWKRDLGWRFGETRNDQSKTHPDLVNWADLPEAEQNKNLDFIRHLPALLADLGFQIDR